MMAAAASAIGVVLGQEIEISVPDIRVIDDPEAAAEIYGSSPHATSTTFLIGGESCRLIQLVPRAFVVRMARALDELEGETVDDNGSPTGEAAKGGTAQSMALVEALTDIKVRVWAELGRTELGLSRALGLPLGSVVELDRPADAPVDLYVNGIRFAQGHLIVTDDGEWAFQCDAVGGRAVPETSSPEMVAAVSPEDTSEVIEEAPVEAVEVAPEAVEEAEAVEEEDVDEAVEAEAADDTEDVIAAETPAQTPEAPPTPNPEGAVD